MFRFLSLVLLSFSIQALAQSECGPTVTKTAIAVASISHDSDFTITENKVLGFITTPVGYLVKWQTKLINESGVKEAYQIYHSGDNCVVTEVDRI